ncbi:PREDICTED: disease resistance protein At4g27190-like [Nelumbo nucifera]|uniref:Disease resistance protein At4g27190-like n=2 Tax=Nelumbo nucifera TaxID=4432 RepID=A0A1U8B979_NELNU|nr:PREDICTED: disease resistance protein At4g27190-like [Nelumbo nucifera]DAD39637.1 TPA_asm: hypothetical protein HUJ06_013960 [Nelumbo nucifera]
MEVLTILSSFAGLLIEGGKCLSREIGYFIDYKENNDELKTQMEDLLAKRRDIKKFVEAALMRGEEIREAVGHWTRSVDKIEEEVINFHHDFESVQNDGKCRIGCCPARYILGKKAIKKLTYVSSLIERAPSPYQVSIPPSIPRSVTSAMGDLMPLESRSLDRNSVMEALKNENIHMIGVYGMEGVGKTTLIRQVGKQAEEEGVFYHVVVVVVSQTPNLKNIQGAIAEMLGLKLNENDSIEIRANTLYTRLKQEKSVLIILDDLSERVDLSHIGIPHGNEHKGCKVLLTTRDQNVCHAMGREDSQSMKTIELGVLSEQEAWALFRWSTGEVVESLELIVVASEVAAQCRGLPLTIVTLGRALHGKQEIGAWEHAATELKNSKATNIKEMERSIVYSCIKFSYEQLPNEEIKQLFLLCCLFPKDHNISVEEVVEYGMGEGLFEDIDMLDEARGKAQRIINNLKDCRLLLNGDERKVSYLRCGLDREIGHVRVHEVVRDMGISIASSSSSVEERQELNGWPPSNNKRESKDEHVRRMSLMHNQILELPSQLEYPQLQTLLMQFNYMLEEVTIPDTFFEGMAALRVLGLTNNGYMPVPMSLYSLTNLRTLRLHCKKTSNLSGLRELRELQILVLTVTSDKEHMLPKELGQLTNLRLLDFQCNNNSITIAPQVI